LADEIEAKDDLGDSVASLDPRLETAERTGLDADAHAFLDLGSELDLYPEIHRAKDLL
jgi:hypothetical protein